MGALRLILAISVIVAHLPSWWVGFRPLVGGEVAVEIFFIISGFYMSLVLSGKYRKADGSLRLTDFYIARAIRIYPAYWLVLVCVLIWAILSQSNIFEIASELGPLYTIWATISNVVLFGQDGLFFAKVTEMGTVLVDALGRGDGPQPYNLLLIVPSWTLSLELMFYCLAPWFSKRKTTTLVLIALGVGLLRVVAYQLGFDGDPWRYRFFPFELTFFVGGMVAHRVYNAGMLLHPAYAFALMVALVIYPLFPEYRVYSISINSSLALIAAFLAVPCLFHLTKDWSFDRMIGELSYPLYLVHLPVMTMLAAQLAGINPLFSVALVVLISLAAAWVLELVSARYLGPAMNALLPNFYSGNRKSSNHHG
jgi:peptidoglycan/LPS O-acetylase OafA/YrhL